MPDPDFCSGCQKAPIRPTGEYITRVEAWADRRLYCEACAADWLRDDEPAFDEDHDA
jgi:hypothetical protein